MLALEPKYLRAHEFLEAQKTLNRDVTLAIDKYVHCEHIHIYTHTHTQPIGSSALEFLNKSKSNISAIDANNDMGKIEDTRSNRS